MMVSFWFSMLLWIESSFYFLTAILKGPQGRKKKTDS